MGVRQQKIVAVDVGQHSLNMVLSNGQGMITKAVTVRVPDGVIISSRLNSPDMLAASLREARSKGKIYRLFLFHAPLKLPRPGV